MEALAWKIQCRHMELGWGAPKHAAYWRKKLQGKYRATYYCGWESQLVMGGPPSQNPPESFVASLKVTTASNKRTTSAMQYFNDTRSVMRTWCNTSGEDVLLFGWTGQAAEETARQAMQDKGGGKEDQS